MDFDSNQRTTELVGRLERFMEDHIYPAERTFADELRAAKDPHHQPEVMEGLKQRARDLGLWNLFLPDSEWGAGLTNLEYAPLAEITGRSLIAPEALNCSAPDTGNMEILTHFATDTVRERWLVPLLAGEIRSCFSMTEPAVASSDAANLETRITRDSDQFVVNGRKWWSSGAASTRCKVAIVLGVTDPDAEPHRRQSMVVVPIDSPGVKRVRTLPIFGYEFGHDCEIVYDNVHVPAENLLGEQGGGFAIGQARLGPGRIHHAMRCIGMAERAFDLMCARAHQRAPFGTPLADQGVVHDWIAESRILIEQARLLVLKTAWLMDTTGNKAARVEISAIKVAATRAASYVVDRAIQVFGGAGVGPDTPLAEFAAVCRTLHIADGPDEVHKASLARRELRRYAPTSG